MSRHNNNNNKKKKKINVSDQRGVRRPPERMAEHKIQSTSATDAVKRKGAVGASPHARDDDDDDEEAFDNFDSSPAVPRSKRLVVDLDPVPKFLKNLVDGWVPQGNPTDGPKPTN